MVTAGRNPMICQNCGEPMPAQRSTKKWCSVRCTSAAKRKGLTKRRVPKPVESSGPERYCQLRGCTVSIDGRHRGTRFCCSSHAKKAASGGYLQSAQPHHVAPPTELSIPPGEPVKVRRVADLTAEEAQALGLDRWHYVVTGKKVNGKWVKAEFCGLDGLPAVARRIRPRTEYRCQTCVDEDGLKPTSAQTRDVHGY